MAKRAYCCRSCETGKKMNLFLDTSCLVSFSLFDAHSAKAQLVLEKIAKGEIHGLISALSMAELCGAVRRTANEEIAKEARSNVAQLFEKGLAELVPLNNRSALAAAELAIITSLKGADAVVVNAAKEAKCKLFTFDDEIKKKAKGYVEFRE